MIDVSKQQARIALDRELVRRPGGLHTFIKKSWHVVEPGAPFKDNWSVGAIAEHLEAVHRGEIKRLIINEPPGTMKSLETCVFWPVWSWIMDPGSRWFFASFDAKLTLRDSGRAIRILQSDWFRERWGERVMLRKKDPAEGYFENSAAGLRFASSVAGTALGRAHPDFQVIDDPIKPKGMSAITLAAAQDWLQGTMASRWRNAPTGRRVMIMQRLHEDDLAGYEMAKGGYDVVRLPMRYESANPCVTSLGVVDKRTEEGELLWPERFPEESVQAMEKDMGPNVAAAQLQQRPAPAGGAVFQEQWFRTWIKKGAHTGHLDKVGRKWTAIPDQWDTMIQSWDLAFKGSDTSDWVVGQVWGRKGAEFFLLHQYRARVDFPGTLTAVRAMTAAWPRARVKLIEDKANGPAVIAMLRKEIPGIVPVNPDGGKEARANAVSPYYAAGNVYWPDETEKGFEWVPALRGEHLVFPFGKHDDSVDAATQALNYMTSKFFAFTAAMQRVRSEGGLR